MPPGETGEDLVAQTTSQRLTGARILLVDDDPIILANFSGLLETKGCEVTGVASGSEAIRFLRGSDFDVVITDVAAPQRDGFELLRQVKQNHPGTEVILLSRYGTIESAVEAIRQGAHNYLAKPVTHDMLSMAVLSALARRRFSAGAAAGRQVDGNFSQVIGGDHRMLEVFEMADAVADSQSTVLITGESGTGKSLIARAIHSHSSRRAGPFVEVACGAIAETLLTSELFGHIRGAFTHAINDKPGKFDVADGGTIFLDEVSTASPQLQVKLLRVLQDRQFEPVGSNETRQVDVRVLLATNRDLWQEVAAGRFRKDLYYRVNVVNIELPPLRDRRGDILPLAEHFLGRFLRASTKEILGFCPAAVEAMRRYHWPGNVRELENCVERAVVLCRDAFIDIGDLAPAVLTDDDSASHPGPGRKATLQDAVAEAESQAINAALLANDGCRQVTAEQLGINRTTLYKKMKRYGLEGM